MNMTMDQEVRNHSTQKKPTSDEMDDGRVEFKWSDGEDLVLLWAGTDIFNDLDTSSKKTIGQARTGMV